MRINIFPYMLSLKVLLMRCLISRSKTRIDKLLYSRARFSFSNKLIARELLDYILKKDRRYLSEN